ncbi:MAG: hypothetical protein KAW49_10605, partial [Anaerolineae bacterium]|nr:hypothetical protein [Anaerolineae bacterium]
SLSHKTRVWANEHWRRVLQRVKTRAERSDLSPKWTLVSPTGQAAARERVAGLQPLAVLP